MKIHLDEKQYPPDPFNESSPHFVIYCYQCGEMIRSCGCKEEFKSTKFELCKTCKEKDE